MLPRMKPNLLRVVRRLLHYFHELHILISGIKAQDVHLKTNAFEDEGLPDPASPDHGNGLAGDFVTQEWQKRMPRAPLVLADKLFTGPELPCHRAHHEKGKLRSGICQDVRGIGEWDLVAVR